MKRLILLAFLVFLFACTPQTASRQEEIPQAPIASREFTVGLAGVIPRHFPNATTQDWQDFVNGIPAFGEAYGAYGAWNDNPDEKGIPEPVRFGAEVAKQKELIQVLAIGFEVEGVSDESFWAGDTEGFKRAVLSTAETYKPEYLAIGVEVNRLSPQAFNDFAATYRELYDGVKAISPDTKVFTIFQLEYLKGNARRTGLDLNESWSLLDQFEGKLDIVGLTTYPFLEYDSVDEMPADYYLQIMEKTPLPIGFTELGWPSNAKGIKDDEDAFLNSFLERTQSLDKEFVLWPFLHDADFPEGDLFDSMGLYTNEGEEKPALRTWRSLVQLQRS